MNRFFSATAFLLSVGLAIAACSTQTLSAQAGPHGPDGPVDETAKSAVFDSIFQHLNQTYVFPETAKHMEAYIRDQVAAGAYEKITSGQAFAQKLSDDLQSVSKDKHLNVRYSHETLPQRSDAGQPTAEEMENQQRWLRQTNFGFQKVERLPGNVGYIDLRGFMGPELGKETVAAAMNFVAHTDALIFDLRKNGGGDPEMVALISSYLFGEEKVHLNDLYWRKEDRTDQFWTAPEKVSGARYADKDIYVLTSNRTFSAGEEFTYNLQNLQRATIVGETTGGGAHPGDMVRLHDHFRAFIPSGRAINPVSKTNWEGTGVKPDVPVAQEIALETAYLQILAKKLAAAADEEERSELQGLIDKTNQEIAAKSVGNGEKKE